MKSFNYSPGGNCTSLIDNQSLSISPKKYTDIASKQLRNGIEQVGFIVPGKTTTYKLEMMGGEFCINALRALAHWAYQKTGANKFQVESSGTKELVDLEIETWAKIKISKKYTVIKLTSDTKLILLEGICHFVLESPELEVNKAKRLLNKLKQTYSNSIKNYAAVGLICVNDSRLFPLVEVIPTGTQIFETACGSGTLAAYIASDCVTKAWEQPSGTVFLSSHNENYFYLNGPVSEIK